MNTITMVLVRIEVDLLSVVVCFDWYTYMYTMDRYSRFFAVLWTFILVYCVTIEEKKRVDVLDRSKMSLVLAIGIDVILRQRIHEVVMCRT